MIQEGMRSTSEAIEKPSMTRLFKVHNRSDDMEITVTSAGDKRSLQGDLSG